ncbi:hypothetical protein [Liquorilactobacillus hordei]|uniref:hypothetical protein n=1 Tax=Liquorilactobacillus hordei TaxID=468911 RepID=UPI001CC05B8D|nr:hypothetical protein [Liquorilactobacillus hordei]MBZ2406673.1 hypothetical protein [Liquorilactobacillus hordei]
MKLLYLTGIFKNSVFDIKERKDRYGIYWYVETPLGDEVNSRKFYQEQEKKNHVKIVKDGEFEQINLFGR